MNVGDKITMYFTFSGMTTEEEHVIDEVDDTTITLDEYIFDRKTGKCKNDNTWGGASRKIDPS